MKNTRACMYVRTYTYTLPRGDGGKWERDRDRPQCNGAMGSRYRGLEREGPASSVRGRGARRGKVPYMLTNEREHVERPWPGRALHPARMDASYGYSGVVLEVGGGGAMEDEVGR